MARTGQMRWVGWAGSLQFCVVVPEFGSLVHSVVVPSYGSLQRVVVVDSNGSLALLVVVRCNGSLVHSVVVSQYGSLKVSWCGRGSWLAPALRGVLNAAARSHAARWVGFRGSLQ